MRIPVVVAAAGTATGGGTTEESYIAGVVLDVGRRRRSQPGIAQLAGFASSLPPSSVLFLTCGGRHSSASLAANHFFPFAPPPPASSCVRLALLASPKNIASHTSCISQPASVSTGESSWAMHFAGFLASSAHIHQETDRHGGGLSESSFSSGFSSSFDSLGDDSFFTSDMVCSHDDDDDSLQDTACSSAAGPKVASMHDMSMKSMVTMDAKKMNNSQLAKYFLEADTRQQATATAQETISTGKSNENQLYECNDLRKKGLCLVPLSMLIDYIG
ncbi:hypothetical protein ACQ4PT_041359 [Festuca glaucescens]